MRFCTVINCMDGRIQIPVIRYLQRRFNVEYVDLITEAGPNLILAEQKDLLLVQSVLDRVDISIKNHNSTAIAIVGHYDCAGNRASENEQKKHIQKAVEFLKARYSSAEIIGLWVDEKWEVHEVPVREIQKGIDKKRDLN